MTRLVTVREIHEILSDETLENDYPDLYKKLKK